MESKLAGFIVEPSLKIDETPEALKCSGRIKVSPDNIESDIAKLVLNKPYLEYEGIAIKDGEEVKIRTMLHLSGPLDNYVVSNSKPFKDGFYDIELLS